MDRNKPFRQLAQARINTRTYHHVAYLSNESALRRSIAAAPEGLLREVTVCLKPSFSYEGFGDPHTDTVVQRLLNAGAIPLIRCNMPDHGLGWDTHSRTVGQTLNAFLPSLPCGGSSGGCSAAVALGDVDLGLASDVGGSIRIPAALHNVYGFKPSIGVVPSGPLSLESYLLGSAGFIASSLRVLATAAEVAIGPTYSRVRQVPNRQVRVRIGILDTDAGQALKTTFDAERMQMIELTSDALMQATQQVWLAAMRSTFLAILDDPGDWPLRRQIASIVDLAKEAPLGAVWRTRQGVSELVNAYFSKCDLLACSVLPPVGLYDMLRSSYEGRLDRLLPHLAPTLLGNVLGLPSLSLRASGPRGLQLMGPVGLDLGLLQLATHLTNEDLS